MDPSYTQDHPNLLSPKIWIVKGIECSEGVYRVKVLTEALHPS